MMTSYPRDGQPAVAQMNAWPVWRAVVAGRDLDARAATKSEARAAFKYMLRGPLPAGVTIKKGEAP